MTPSLETTMGILTHTRNDAAAPVLVGALEGTDAVIFDAAIKALVTRRNWAGHLAVLSRWHVLTPAQREVVREAGRGRMSAGLRDALLADDEQTFQNGCEVVTLDSEFDLMSTLISLAENRDHKHSDQATELAVRLVSLLNDMLHGRTAPDDRRDPATIRRHVLESLERSVLRFRTHHRAELIEAFVVLGSSSSGLLRSIIDDQHHACYATVMQTLSSSQSPDVIKLLLGFLEMEHASMSALTVLSRRSDVVFVKQFLDFAGRGLSDKALKNLSRIRNFTWLDSAEHKLSEFSELEQAHAVMVLSNSGIKQDQLYSLLEDLLKTGEPAGRAASCMALGALPGDRPNHLILAAVEDPAPVVQAAAIRQLRERRLPGAMNLLLKYIDSPHEVVRAAARDSLTEYTMENYLQQFDTLSDEARRATGALVRKVDHEALEKLIAELESQSRKNRLKAIDVAEAMGLVCKLSSEMIERLTDEDHLVRAAAADVLQYCPTREVQDALEDAASDRSSAVQSAAKNSLAVFAGMNLGWGPAYTENSR